MVEAEQREIRCVGSGDQSAREVNGIERTQGLERKRLAGSRDYLAIDAEHVPVGCGTVEQAP